MNVESEHWIEALFSKAQYIDTLSRVNQGPRPVFSDDCIAIQCLLWIQARYPVLAEYGLTAVC